MPAWGAGAFAPGTETADPAETTAAAVSAQAPAATVTVRARRIGNFPREKKQKDPFRKSTITLTIQLPPTSPGPIREVT